MQCMMKEVCAQCLQRHVDPATGREEFIFSCYNQDQELDRVDFANLQARLRQNTVQEKLSNLWFEHLLDQAEVSSSFTYKLYSPCCRPAARRIDDRYEILDAARLRRHGPRLSRPPRSGSATKSRSR